MIKDYEAYSIAFKFKDGTILLIEKEDVRQIAMQIIAEGTAKGNVSLKVMRDSNVSKADTLIRLISQQPTMEADLKRQYLEKILELLGTPGDEEEVETEIPQSEETVATYRGPGRPRKEQ